MKKSLIALAVAGAFAAPAFAATSNVDVYGVMSIAIQDTDAANVDIAVVDNVSRIGFKGTEDLGGGLKAVWQIESQVSAAGGNDGVGTNTIAGRNTFIGLSGGFGTAVIGRHDTPYKLGTGSLDIFADTIGDYNGRAINGVTGDVVGAAHDARVANAIAYISPEWSGFHFAVAAVATNSDVVPTAGIATLGNLGSGDGIDALSATGIYKNGPLFASLSYQNVEVLDNLGLDPNWKLGVSYTMGDTTVGFIYEDSEIGSIAATPAAITATGRDNSWLLNAKHNMGPITLKAQYGKINDVVSVNVTTGLPTSGVGDVTKWDLGADYNLSKRTTAYFVYSSVDKDGGADGKGWNLGMKHSF